MADLDPFDLGLMLADALEAHGVPYALGVALAYGVWAVPRGTLDVDINVFVDEPELDRAFDALDTVLDAPLDRQRARRESRDDGLFVLHLGPCRIHVFTPSIPFSREAQRTRRAIEIDGRAVYFLSAESLAVFERMFFRTKDIADLERLLALGRADFDRAYVRAQIAAIMGDDDPRVQRWDELCERFAATA